MNVTIDNNGIPIRIIDGSIPYTPEVESCDTTDEQCVQIEALNGYISSITDTGISDPLYQITNVLSQDKKCWLSGPYPFDIPTIENLYIDVVFSVPVVLKEITLMRDADPNGRILHIDHYSPKVFDIIGISDGVETTIESIENILVPGDGKPHTFPVENTMTYKEYRFHVREPVGRGALGYFLQLTNVTFRGMKG